MIHTEDMPITPPHVPLIQPASILAGSSNGDMMDSFELVLRPQSGWIGINWREMIAHRDLLFYLIWRDVVVRYKQTILGPAWAVLQPLILMLIFTFVFGRIGQIRPVGFDYPVFVFAGLIPWSLFSQGMSQSSLSLVNQQNLLTKVYFPRLFVPIAAGCVFLVDLMISLIIYAIMLLYYRTMPSWTIIFVPVLILLTLIATLAFGILISALTVFYRDFKHIVPFLTQLFMFITPVIFPPEMLTRRYEWILALNPMFGIVCAYRWAILGVDLNPSTLAISTVSTLALFVFALFYFRRTERRFADFA